MGLFGGKEPEATSNVSNVWFNTGQNATAIDKILSGFINDVSNIGAIPDMPDINYGDYINAVKGGMGQAMGVWSNQMSGQADRSALEAAKQANAAAAQRGLEQNLLPTISESANMAGGAGGSRQGIAEGLAVTQANQDLMDRNARMEYQFQQDMLNRQGQAAGNFAQTGMSGMNTILGLQKQAGQQGLINAITGSDAGSSLFQIMLLAKGLNPIAGWGGTSTAA